MGAWRRGQRPGVGKGARELRRDTYCRTASAGPCSARAASAPSAGTGTGPWLRGPPGPTWRGPLPAGQTCGSPRPASGPPAGCGGRPPRPCRPFVAMPCFMHEGNFIPILRAWCLRELLRRARATAPVSGERGAQGEARSEHPSWGGGRRPWQEPGHSQPLRNGLEFTRESLQVLRCADPEPGEVRRYWGALQKPMCTLVTKSWPAFETSALLLPCEETGACEGNTALASLCQCCTGWSVGVVGIAHILISLLLYTVIPRVTLTTLALLHEELVL